MSLMVSPSASVSLLRTRTPTFLPVVVEALSSTATGALLVLLSSPLSPVISSLTANSQSPLPPEECCIQPQPEAPVNPLCPWSLSPSPNLKE